MSSSPAPRERQREGDDAIHAGRQLFGKEFRSGLSPGFVDWQSEGFRPFFFVSNSLFEATAWPTRFAINKRQETVTEGGLYLQKTY